MKKSELQELIREVITEVNRDAASKAIKVAEDISGQILKLSSLTKQLRDKKLSKQVTSLFYAQSQLRAQLHQYE